MADEARLTAASVRRVDGGAGGYSVENPFGAVIQVLPRPPAFEATIRFAWDGAMPDEIRELLARARAAGVAIDAPR